MRMAAELSAETGGTINLRSTTVSDNEADADRNGGGDGGGLFASTSGGGGTITLRNTLVGGNHDPGGEAPTAPTSAAATISSLGRNMIGNTNGCGYIAGPRRRAQPQRADPAAGEQRRTDGHPRAAQDEPGDQRRRRAARRPTSAASSARSAAVATSAPGSWPAARAS